jgi:putative Holliday junction resolvase
MMRTLAIDLGTRRVGLALSDEGGRFATPLEVISVASADGALGAVIETVRREGVQRIVVGLPLNMDDSVGPQARSVMDWADRLRRQTSVPIVFIDERLSSFDAEQQLISRKRAGEKLTRRRKKEQLDALAAASFLQAFLDGKLPPVDFGRAAAEQ